MKKLFDKILNSKIIYKILLVIGLLMTIDSGLILARQNPLFYNIPLLKYGSVNEHCERVNQYYSGDKYLFVFGPLYYVRAKNNSSMDYLDIGLSKKVEIGIWGLPGIPLINEEH